MFQFLAGILLIQAATALLILLAGRDAQTLAGWLPVIVASAMVALIAAFWFASLAARRNHAALERLRAEFAREREHLRVVAEREKTRLVRQNQKTLTRETRRVESRANTKVGVVVASAAGLGLLMVVANFVTLGLLTLTGAGAALGGYLVHRRWFGQSDGATSPRPLVRRLGGLLRPPPQSKGRDLSSSKGQRDRLPTE
jgi:hypothetical protein